MASCVLSLRHLVVSSRNPAATAACSTRATSSFLESMLYNVPSRGSLSMKTRLPSSSDATAATHSSFDVRSDPYSKLSAKARFSPRASATNERCSAPFEGAATAASLPSPKLEVWRPSSLSNWNFFWAATSAVLSALETSPLRGAGPNTCSSSSSATSEMAILSSSSGTASASQSVPLGSLTTSQKTLRRRCFGARAQPPGGGASSSRKSSPPFNPGEALSSRPGARGAGSAGSKSKTEGSSPASRILDSIAARGTCMRSILK
mmetsp:Transcript_12234/g.36911  ORF Transcript_12234/g.36911 Transcript_12234/m.36911 type:complete len:263 (-) Transcript_12234:1918-2706(-)